MRNIVCLDTYRNNKFIVEMTAEEYLVIQEFVSRMAGVDWDDEGYYDDEYEIIIEWGSEEE